MNILLTVLEVIGSIVAIFFIIALSTPRHFKIEREVNISKSRQQVFDYLKMIRNQEKYSVWVMKDPAIKINYVGVDGTVGFTSSWVSENKNVGIGEQEIKSISEGESMEVEIRFKKPFEATNHAITNVSTTADGKTRVINAFYGKCKFPMNVMNLFMGRLVGKDMQQNLENLKNNLES
jgi:uncharacterized protein YndB with AHSA1/START domain